MAREPQFQEEMFHHRLTGPARAWLSQPLDYIKGVIKRAARKATKAREQKLAFFDWTMSLKIEDFSIPDEIPAGKRPGQIPPLTHEINWIRAGKGCQMTRGEAMVDIEQKIKTVKADLVADLNDGTFWNIHKHNFYPNTPKIKYPSPPKKAKVVPTAKPFVKSIEIDDATREQIDAYTREELAKHEEALMREHPGMRAEIRKTRKARWKQKRDEKFKQEVLF